jgi:hypothetical protein
MSILCWYNSPGNLFKIDRSNYFKNSPKTTLQPFVPPPVSLQITRTDMNHMVGSNQFTDESFSYLQSVVKPKMEQFREMRPANHVINSTLYDEVFVTSDIHADFRKLLQIFQSAGLIALPEGIDPYTEAIYDLDIICETRWLKPRTLVILVGDIVDGMRNDPQKHLVDDKIGSFEFLIHSFLYNIRLKAIQEKGEVMFVLGNHDLDSVILQNEHNITENVHPTTWKFFGNATFNAIETIHPMKPTLVDFYLKTHRSDFFNAVKNRTNALVEFYKNCPYGFLSLEHDGIKDSAFVHGGFHNEHHGIGLLKGFGIVQTKIDKTLDVTELRHHKESYDSIWSRRYQYDLDRCRKVEELGYSQIVVGHCTTPIGGSRSGGSGYKSYRQLYDAMSDKTYAGECMNDQRGCVLLDCYQKGNPTLSYVDIASSAAFRQDRFTNQQRPVEILKLTKSGHMPYYTVSKITIDPSHMILPVRTDKFPSPTPRPTPESAGGTRKGSSKRARGNARGNARKTLKRE